MILINDYSNGNDMLIGAPGISGIKDLKGKKIGVEIGFVSHLLVMTAREANGMKESDVVLVNVPTNETPQVLASGDVSAISAWQPNSGAALKLVPGSKPLFTSADAPGLIYDVLAVSPESLAARAAEWKQVIEVWYDVVAYIKDPKTADDAVKIMASRVGVKPEEYKPFLQGTKILTLEDAKAYFAKAEGFKSIYGSSTVSDDFNVANKVYDKPQDVDAYIDLSLSQSLLKK
jgi:NitT/TauT family transport system substrate-binding protein